MLLGDASAGAEISASFLWPAVILAVGMLIWDAVEVGRNDAANIVNAVFGSRILTRKNAVRVAAVGVILGATLASDVVETARKGIFSPNLFTIQAALSIYIAVYIVDTILLYTYSAFGMPVSTTMTLVFELLGAALFLALLVPSALQDPAQADVVQWDKAGKVLLGIVCSILLSGIMGFLLQRAARGAIGDRWFSLPTLLLHGGWVGGGLMAGLSYFMLTKGMKDVAIIKSLKQYLDVHFGAYRAPVFIIFLWGIYAVAIQFILRAKGKAAARLLFPVLTIIGMLCMAFAFGQNDLANCASPGLAAIKLFQGYRAGDSIKDITAVPIPRWALFGCGVLLVLGMATRHAQRVTRAEVNTGSAGHHVRLWAPKWCIRLAAAILRRRQPGPVLSPVMTRSERGKTMHYDPLRACIIVSVAASVITTASGLGLPVSTTYVAFSAVVATGMADRIFVHGDAALKLGRSIWVVFSWFAAAVIACFAAGIVCVLIFKLGAIGMVASLIINFIVRQVAKRASDAQEEAVRREAEERRNPEDFALETE